MGSVDDAIRKAMEEGKFDDLPGKGKPLNLDENPLEDPEWRMAYRLLRSNGYLLPWIEMRQEIEKDLAEARQALYRAFLERQAESKQPETGPAWRRALEAFRTRVDELNSRIRSYNLQVPSERFQRLPIQAENEITGLSTADFHQD